MAETSNEEEHQPNVFVHVCRRTAISSVNGAPDSKRYA